MHLLYCEAVLGPRKVYNCFRGFYPLFYLSFKKGLEILHVLLHFSFRKKKKLENSFYLKDKKV